MRLIRARSMMLSLILVLLAACGPAPAATVPDSPGTATAPAAVTEPAKVISGDSLTIGLPTIKNEYYDQYQDYVTRLQALLYAAGWEQIQRVVAHLPSLDKLLPQLFLQERCQLI